ncbi:FHA domain-containing protein [bacterium]|nr:FHA domain-containing protein [bacterium]
MRLVALSGDQQFSFPLRQGSTLIGRQSDCHICIPAHGISRKHCQLYVDGDTVTIRDLGSANHMFVNGRPAERADLHDGDVITLGQFQLRFEAAPAGAYPPPPVDGDVIDVEPEYSDDANTQPLYSQPAQDAYAAPQDYGAADAGVPPPTDFPEQPSGDDTPVDNGFMPAAYTGGQQQIGGGAGQPQLIVREGQWFLRDPATGREIEIAPKDGSALPGAAAPPNKRLMVTIAVAALVGVIAFAAMFLREPPPKPNRNDQESRSKKYNQVIDIAIKAIRDEKLADAVSKLEVAAEVVPDIETAPILIRYIRLIEKKPATYGLTDAERLLDSLRDVPSLSNDAKAFTSGRLSWILKERAAYGKLADAKDQLVHEGENEETLKTFIKQLSDIPQDTRAGKLAKADIGETGQKLANFFLSRAEQAVQSQRWTTAVQLLGSAKEYVANPAEVDKRIELYQSHERDRLSVERAREDVANKNYVAAIPPLEAIKAPSPYVGEAEALLAQIQAAKTDLARKALLDRALQLYKEGDGPGAIKMIKENALTELSYIEGRVKHFDELFATAKKAEADGRFNEAFEAIEEAVGVETSADSEYRRRAEEKRQALNARRPQMAAQLASEGYDLIEDDPKKARELFNEALKLDPEQAKAIKGLVQLQRNANFLRNDGLQALTQKKYDTARRLLKRALDSAAPGSTLYNTLLRDLRKLPPPEPE